MTFRNSSVIDRWLAGGRARKNATLRVKTDDVLYSYNLALATIDRDKKLVMVANETGWLTSQMQGSLTFTLAVTRGFNTVYVKDPLLSPMENYELLIADYGCQLDKCRKSIDRNKHYRLRMLKDHCGTLADYLFLDPINKLAMGFNEVTLRRAEAVDLREKNRLPNLLKALAIWKKSKTRFPRTRWAFRELPEEIRIEKVVPLVLFSSYGRTYSAADIMDHKCQNLTTEQLDWVNDVVQAWVAPTVEVTNGTV